MWLLGAKSNMAAVGHDENLIFLLLRVYTPVIPLFRLIPVWNSFLRIPIGGGYILFAMLHVRHSPPFSHHC